MNSPEDDDAPPEAREVAKKRSRLNTLILALVFVLGIALPQPYKAFAPILFLIPLVIAVMNKVRQAGEKSGTPLPNQTYSPPMPDQNHSVEPYSYTPKDPKDPRRYKPIG